MEKAKVIKNRGKPLSVPTVEKRLSILDKRVPFSKSRNEGQVA